MTSPSPEFLGAMSAALERGLPLTREPFDAVARGLGVREADAVEATRALLAGGFLRHIGAFVDFRPLGLAGYLFGLRTPERVCRELALRLAEMECVTHIYGRRAPLNLWFTAILPGDEAALGLSGDLRIYPHVALAAVKRIKLEPCFARGERHTGKRGAGKSAHDGYPSEPWEGSRVLLSPEQRTILRLAQTAFPVESRPFARIGSRAGVSEEGVLACLRELTSLGVLRRVGASLHHVRSGYSFNSLLAWNFSVEPEADVLAAASRITGNAWLSHCYLRRVLTTTLDFDWRYNLFTMIHARSEGELCERERALTSALGGRSPLSMRTEREWKKTPYRIEAAQEQSDL